MKNVFRFSPILALVVVLAGCSGGGASAPGSELDGVKPDPAAARRAQAALDDARSMNTRLDTLENQLIRRCMVAKGFDVFPSDPTAAPDTAAQAELPPTLAEARANGYGGAPPRQSDGAAADTGSAWAETSDEYKQRFTQGMEGDPSKVTSYDVGGGTVSTPAGGCVGETRKKLRGDVREYLRLEWIADNEVRLATEGKASQDENLVRAQAAWKDCMGKKGVDVRTRGDIPGLVTGIYTDEVRADAGRLRAARTAEIALAVEDAECADASGLRQATADAKAAAGAVVLTKHEKDLVAWRQMVQAALGRAEALLKTK